MNRQYYMDLARQGISMPIGADLVLREKPDHDARLLDGRGLGEVVVETARRFKTPLALPLMDLALEKEWLLTILGVDAHETHTHHFSQCPPVDSLEKVKAGLQRPPTPRIQATCDALRHVATQSDLVPVGMAIGPFSLMTKLLADPITGVYMAGTGLTAEEDDEVRTLEMAMELGLAVILRTIELQAAAGARAICLCEPAANLVYLSPKQIDEGSDVFERYVMRPNLQIRRHMEALGIDLMFHDCGELKDSMVARFNELDPAILSLGSSRKLWLDAGHVSKNTVLFGNLPTKKFYSDADVPLEMVEAMTRDLMQKMAATGHPFILGSECDVLSVPGASDRIIAKVDRMQSCGCLHHSH